MFDVNTDTISLSIKFHARYNAIIQEYTISWGINYNTATFYINKGTDIRPFDLC